jgi:hypothetical protein
MSLQSAAQTTAQSSALNVANRPSQATATLASLLENAIGQAVSLDISPEARLAMLELAASEKSVRLSMSQGALSGENIDMVGQQPFDTLSKFTPGDEPSQLAMQTKAQLWAQALLLASQMPQLRMISSASENLRRRRASRRSRFGDSASETTECEDCPADPDHSAIPEPRIARQVG